MATSLGALPLLRNGEEYISQSKKSLFGIHGEKLLDVAMVSQLV